MSPGWQPRGDCWFLPGFEDYRITGHGYVVESWPKEMNTSFKYRFEDPTVTIRMSAQGKHAVCSTFHDNADPGNPQQVKGPAWVDVTDRLRGVDAKTLVIDADAAQDSVIPPSVTSTTLLTSDQ